MEAVRVVRDAQTGKGKGVAFILFRTSDASKAALKAQKGRELKGRKLRLERVKKQAGSDGKAAWQQGRSSDAKGSKSGKRKPGGKRPAVLARKQAAKLAAKGRKQA